MTKCEVQTYAHSAHQGNAKFSERVHDGPRTSRHTAQRVQGALFCIHAQRRQSKVSGKTRTRKSGFITSVCPCPPLLAPSLRESDCAQSDADGQCLRRD